MEQMIGKHWHHLPIKEVVDLLESDSEQGLDLFEINHRREQFGPNVLTTPKGKGWLLRLVLQSLQPLDFRWRRPHADPPTALHRFAGHSAIASLWHSFSPNGAVEVGA